MKTTSNAFLRQVSKDKDLKFTQAQFNLSLKGENYEVVFLNSFNISFDVYIKQNNLIIKHYRTSHSATIQTAIELIKEFLSK